MAVTLSRPRSGPWPSNATWAQYSFESLPILACEGPGFDESWHTFRLGVTRNWARGFPLEEWLVAFAQSLVNTWGGLVDSGAAKHARILIRRDPLWKLEGFCLYGFATALFVIFRHTLALEHLQLIQTILGWRQWPLDFMESSPWPPLQRILALHLEMAERRNNTSWSAELTSWADDSSYFQTLAPADFDEKLSRFFPSGSCRAVFGSIASCTGNSVSTRALRLDAMRGRILAEQRSVRIVVFGHHTGSSLEPFTMLREALKLLGITSIDVQFHGQSHPGPQLLCEELNYCTTNPGIKAWFDRYETTQWKGEYAWMSQGHWNQVISELSPLLKDDRFVMASDVTVCGGPFWMCAMIRGLRSNPILLYFAWPAVPMVPESLRQMLLLQLQVLGQSPTPPVVMLCANRILRAQFALQAQIDVPVLRPHGLYANATHAPWAKEGQKQEVLVTRVGHWARQSGVALFELVGAFMEAVPDYPYDFFFLSVRKKGYHKKSMERVRYADFARFRATIFWPWDVMMLLFNELYTMKMPLLLPANRWMYTLMHHALVETDINWWHLRGDSVSAAVPSVRTQAYPFRASPWIFPTGSILEAAFWYELTDFASFPHVLYFNSLPEIFHIVRRMDIEAIHVGMEAFNTDTLKSSLSFYSDAVVRLLACDT